MQVPLGKNSCIRYQCGIPNHCRLVCVPADNQSVTRLTQRQVHVERMQLLLGFLRRTK